MKRAFARYCCLIAAGLLLAALMASVPLGCAQEPIADPPPLSFTAANGENKTMADFRGKVVCLQLISTGCSHCQQTVVLINKLFIQYRDRGFVPVAVVFTGEGREQVNAFVKQYQILYPVGYTGMAAAFAFLGATPQDRLTVPQLLWFDRQGKVRSRTRFVGDASMASEEALRQTLDRMLADESEVREAR
jgi:AhpC/TSA family